MILDVLPHEFLELILINLHAMFIFNNLIIFILIILIYLQFVKIFVRIFHIVAIIIHFLNLIVNIVVLMAWFITIEYPFFVLNIENVEASSAWVGNEIFGVLLSAPVFGDFTLNDVFWNRLNFKLLLIVEFVT